MVPPVPGCICEPTPCTVSLAPTCDGECPIPGQICEADAATGACTCDPPLLCDQQTPFPACDYECPPGLECQPDASGAPNCACQPTPCDHSPYPQCNGVCPPGTNTECQPALDGTAGCGCQPISVPCEQIPFGLVCDGPCPFPGQTCNPSPDGCSCDPPQDCNPQTPFPACDATCPPGLVCVPDTSTDPSTCRCVPIPCENSVLPECEGPCPGIFESCEFVHLPDGDGCRCVPIIQQVCEAGPFPICDGPCPPGKECIPSDLMGNQCVCVPVLPPVCNQSPFPSCGGLCPVNKHCTTHAWAASCACCPNIVVPDDDNVIFFASKTIIIWQPAPCLKRWHVYRAIAAQLHDVDHDGLADEPFECFLPDLLVPEAEDLSSPPSGTLHFYLVTGENDNGESNAGTTSAGLVRPFFPCP